MAGMSQYVVSILFQGKDQTGTAAKSAAGGITKLAGSVKNLLAGYGMLKGAQQALNFVKMGAEVGRASASLDSLAKAAGTSGKEIVSSMQDASLNTIDRMTAMQTANRALIMDVAKTPEQFERLAKVATVLGRAMGKDAASSIDDFVTAAGRQSKLIADNLGLIINAEDAYQKYADTLGITVDELDDAGKKQAFLTEMLRQGEAKMGALDSTTRDAAGDFEALNSAFKDMKTGSAEVVAELVRMGGGLDWVIGRLKGFPDTLKQLATLSIAFSEGMNAATLSIMTSPNAIRAGESAWEAFQTSILRSTRGAIEGTSEIQRYGYTIQETGEIARYAATTDLPALERTYGDVTGTVKPLDKATRDYLATLAESETIYNDGVNTAGRYADAMVEVGKKAVIAAQKSREAMLDMAEGYTSFQRDATEKAADLLKDREDLEQEHQDKIAEIQKKGQSYAVKINELSELEQLENLKERLEIAYQQQSEFTDKTRQSSRMLKTKQIEDLQGQIATQEKLLDDYYGGRLVKQGQNIGGLLSAEEERYKAELAMLEESAKAQEAEQQRSLGQMVLQQFDAWASMKGFTGQAVFDMRTAIMVEYGLITKEGAAAAELQSWSWDKAFTASGEKAGGFFDMVVARYNALPSEKVIHIRYQQDSSGLGIGADPLDPTHTGMQHGGKSSGGYTWVGERGRELVRLPAGSRVYNHTQSNSYNLNVSSLQQSRGIAMDFAMMRAMGG